MEMAVVAEKWIVVWAATAITASIFGGVTASAKRRDWSVWAAWCFLLPPVLILLLLIPRNTGPPPRPRSLDDYERN
jgi:hypothetical protein